MKANIQEINRIISVDYKIKNETDILLTLSNIANYLYSHNKNLTKPQYLMISDLKIIVDNLKAENLKEDKTK